MQRNSMIGVLAVAWMVLAAGCGAPNMGEPAPAQAQQQPADPNSLTSQAAKVAESVGAVMIAPNLYQLPEVTVPADPAEKAAMEKALVDKWVEDAKTHKENPQNPSCMVTALKLSEFGEEALFPLLDVIGDPNVEPYTKVLAVNCIKQLVNKSMLDKLVPLTQSGLDETTRGCATLLLGQLRNPKAVPRLRELAADPEPRVRFSAVRGLALYGDADGRKELMKIWDAPETSTSEREEIARIFVDDVDHDKMNVPILSKILLSPELDTRFHQSAVAAMGRGLMPDSLPALREAAEKDPDPNVREIAASAANAVEYAMKHPVLPDQDAKKTP